jgi:hypothetical protein
MMALRATAEGGDRFAVVIDKGSGTKKMPTCEQWLNNERGCALRFNPIATRSPALTAP